MTTKKTKTGTVSLTYEQAMKESARALAPFDDAREAVARAIEDALSGKPSQEIDNVPAIEKARSKLAAISRGEIGDATHREDALLDVARDLETIALGLRYRAHAGYFIMALRAKHETSR